MLLPMRALSQEVARMAGERFRAEAELSASVNLQDIDKIVEACALAEAVLVNSRIIEAARVRIRSLRQQMAEAELSAAVRLQDIEKLYEVCALADSVFVNSEIVDLRVLESAPCVNTGLKQTLLQRCAKGAVMK